jgi:hypothetical protein
MIAIAAFLVLAQATGTVTDSTTHQPVRGAHVKAAEEDSVTGDDGSYSIAHPGSGEVQFHVEGKGYRSMETKARIPEGGFLKLDVELHPMARIKGKVVEQDTGKPVSGLLFMHRKEGGLGHGMANPRGVFEIDSLEPGDYVLQLSSTRVYRNFEYPETIHVEEGQQQVVDIFLPPMDSYRVAGTIEIPSGRESETLTIGYRRGDSYLSYNSERHKGPFSIEGLIPGQYTVYRQTGDGCEHPLRRVAAERHGPRYRRREDQASAYRKPHGDHTNGRGRSGCGGGRRTNALSGQRAQSG